MQQQLNTQTQMSNGMGHNMGNGMNQMLELFKMQYLMKFMADGTGKGSIWTMVALLLYDQFAKSLPLFFAFITAWYYQANQKPIKQLELMPSSIPPPITKSIRACIQFERSADAKTVDPRIDAVMYHVCNLPDVRSLRYNGVEMIPNFKDIIMVDNDVWFEVLNPQLNPIPSANKEMKLEPILYRLSTYDHDITWLHKYVEESMVRYEQEKKNKLGSEAYYFDQVISSGGLYRNPISNQICMFNKSKFQSNRSLGNVYLRQIDDLKQRVEFFMRRRDWYDSKGIPHTLGIVMYGHPGCGKTSTIKAIANETKRHIFNIALSEIKTKEALKELFYNDVVHTFVEGKMEVLNIPIKQRVYVIEDIDAMDSVVVKRTNEQQKKDEEKKLKVAAEVELLKQTQGMDAANRMLHGKDSENADSLDLATLLNVLDGVRETPGRIIILSTNYPERLDEALLRPGRFDMMIEFEKHNCEVLKQHVEKYYGVKLTKGQDLLLSDHSLHFKWTPAEVSQILFRRIQSIDAAIKDLREEDPSKLFKFSQLKKEVPQEQTPQNDEGTSLIDLYKGTDSDESVPKKKSEEPLVINAVDTSYFLNEIEQELRNTDDLLESKPDDLLNYRLKEYKVYLESLRTVVLSSEKITDPKFRDDQLVQNKVIFDKAKDSMKAPQPQKIPIIHDYDTDDEFPFCGGGCSMDLDRPSQEQEAAAEIANSRVNLLFGKKDELTVIPTFDGSSTEAAKQYIEAIHSFEEAQDSFFNGFLVNQEVNTLDDYFKETLI